MITSIVDSSQLQLEAGPLREAYDQKPMGFNHNLNHLPHFQRDGLQRLAAAYDDQRLDYVVAGSAANPAEALARLDATPTRLLLKRPELYDPAFRILLDTLFDDLASLHGDLRREDVVRLEAAILITSAASTLPFHFDPEVGFFCQIEGERTYHVYSPDAVAEPELESFYQHGGLDRGQVDLSTRDPAKEYVFDLAPGRGLHQPQNAPFWVQTKGSRSVSYSFVFETRDARLRSRARVFNHYMRRAGLHPLAPGLSKLRDVAKGRAMQVMERARSALEGSDHRACI